MGEIGIDVLTKRNLGVSLSVPKSSGLDGLQLQLIWPRLVLNGSEARRDRVYDFNSGRSLNSPATG